MSTDRRCNMMKKADRDPKANLQKKETDEDEEPPIEKVEEKLD